MKFLLVDVAVSEKEGLSTCWCTLAKLAKESSKTGKLFHHKKSELLQQYPVEKVKNPELFTKLVNTLPGSIIDVEYAVNEYAKAVIKDVTVFKNTTFTYDELYK